MKKLTRILLYVWALGLLGALPARALQLVYPADQTSVHRSDFLIIKGSDQPPLEGMSVEINGAKSDVIDISGADYRAAFQDFLILQPSFDPGRNVVKVAGYRGGQVVANQTATVYYLPGPYDLPPTDFPTFVMHRPEKEALCAGCHNMNPTPEQLAQTTPDTNPCAACHRRMLQDKYVHGPAGAFRCAYCHQPDSQPNRYQSPDGDAGLCNQCHQEKVDEFKKNKFVHGPVAVGLCSVCHDAHASNNPAQVVLPINDLCLSCHAKVSGAPHVVRGIRGEAHPLRGVQDPSQPGRELSCVSCHNPHGGKTEYFFVRNINGRFSLCELCHQK
ncbi:cytochrome c3 family protein [Desulfuromonas carbonis]